MRSSASPAPPSRLAPSGKIDAVGLEHDVEKIMNWLRRDAPELLFIPIAGAGGIGKTTLARNVYHDPYFIDTYEYDIRAWVTVSQEYSFSDIFANLLVSMKKFVREDISSLSKDEIPLKVRQTLTNRRYFIVIDDMWSTKAWDEIKPYFPNNNNTSRIILTTRLEDVAEYVHPEKFHQMQYLKDDQSLSLLKKELCKGECRLPMLETMEDIATRITKSCGGLPLAIVVTAGLLSEVSETEADWEQIAFTSNLAITADEDQYTAILDLSYTNLPHHLRPCFLYMGAFPEDYDIRVSKLVKFWIAEDLVQSNFALKTPEEVAEEWLEDLVRRNLVLVTKRKSNGRIKSCGLHDLLRDLCLMRSLEDNFLLCFMGSFFLPEIFATQLRISISHSNILAHIDGSTIRTIICYSHSSVDSLEKFGLLRVLDMLNSKIPAHVFELIDIRFLAFSYSAVNPASVSRLQNLQTLIIYPNNSSVVVHLPVEIWKMPWLRHLISPSLQLLLHPDGATPPSESLQTLSLAANFECNERVVKMIPNVRKLGVCYSEEKLDGSSYHLENLRCLNQLEKFKMEIRSSFPFSPRLNFVLPESVRKLTLTGWRRTWEDLSIIGSLPNLQVLKLRNYACEGSIWEPVEEEFEQLEFLLIDESNLEEWSATSNHFPKLKCLVLKGCPSLSVIPVDIGYIPTLELIELDGQNKSLVESAKSIQREQMEYENYSILIRY